MVKRVKFNKKPDIKIRAKQAEQILKNNQSVILDKDLFDAYFKAPSKSILEFLVSFYPKEYKIYSDNLYNDYNTNLTKKSISDNWNKIKDIASKSNGLTLNDDDIHNFIK